MRAEDWIAKRMAEKKPDEPIAPDYVPPCGSELNIYGYPIDKVREAMGMASFKAKQDESMRKLDAMEEYYKTQFRLFDYRKDKPEPTFGDGERAFRPFHDIPFDLDDEGEEE